MTIAQVIPNGGHRITPRVTLDSAAPTSIARKFLSARFERAGHQTLIRHRGDYYSWNGSYYKRKDEESMRADVYDFLERATLVGDGGARPYAPTKHKVTSVLDAMTGMVLVDAAVDTPNWLSPDEPAPAKNIIACKNGLYDLVTGRHLQHTPAYFNLSCLPYNYEPDANEPANWLNFLNDLLGQDADAIRTLQEMFGYFVSSDTSQQKMFLVIGPPRSGKGTIAKVLTELLGTANVITPTLSSLASNFGLQGFIGKSAAIIPDARLGNRVDQAVIQERLLSISGEDAQTVDRKFMLAWTGRLSTRFLILSNELPAIADVSGAFASRFIVLNLQRSFLHHEDRSLADRLLGELPAILNWALEGRSRLSARGFFEQPRSAREALLDLEAATSPVKAFVRESCLLGPTHEVRPEEVFREWCKWCESSGRDRPGNLQKFSRDLRAAVPGLKTIQRRGAGGQRERFLQGIGVRGS
jgi:putative DNA primase/helicase